MPMTRSLKFAHVAAIAAALALAGCGGDSAPKKTAKAPDKKGIFISTMDCAAAGILSEDACGKAVDLALKMHEGGKTYPTKGSCEKAEGAERCTNTADGTYRVRLQAYLITLGAEPTGMPLYPSEKKAIGFKDAKKAAVEATDDTLIVSAAAMAVAHDNARLP